MVVCLWPLPRPNTGMRKNLQKSDFATQDDKCDFETVRRCLLMGMWWLWDDTDCRTQAHAWKPPIAVAGIHIICCSLGSVEQPRFSVSSCNVNSAVDVQINVKSPLSFKKSCRRLFFPSSVSHPADPHHARCPGCKRSPTRLYKAETNSWQCGEKLGSGVRCQSQQGGKERLPERLSAGERWMRWEFNFITAATQSKTLHVVLTGKSAMWTPKPATLYQILTIWALIINLKLKCGESLVVFSQVF